MLDASNVVALKLLKGASVGEAVQAAKEKANDEIRHMLVREEPYDSPSLKALVINNILLGYEGDEKATV